MNGKYLSINETFEEYCEAFKTRESQTIYLAPLEFVTFSKGYMNFGTFKVGRFHLRKLEAKLRNRINKIFYPYASFTQEQLKLLSQYWFIEAERFGDVSEIGRFSIPVLPSSMLVFTGYAERICTDHPEPIESALKELCLFDWAVSDRQYQQQKPANRKVTSNKEDEYELWLKFNVPFVIEIKQDLLSTPRSVPNVRMLHTLPDTDSKGEEYEGPEVHIRLDEGETKYFVQFTSEIHKLSHFVEFSKNKWRFFEVAFDYFAKAFFTYPGLEQLLWNIATIEALLLLDEEQEGLTGRLAKRISSILGKDNIEMKSIAKRFRELYEVRSSLVHGKSESKAHVTELVDAYRFSRIALLWFLHYLGDIQNRIINGEAIEGVPTHKEILTILDIDKDSRNCFTWLMEGLSDEFPYMKDWIR
jgi:hypothetical protein